MSHQPTPFSLIMPQVPAYMSDGEIARLWQNCEGVISIRSIQMEPFMSDVNDRQFNQVTIHFNDLSLNGREREKIKNGYYTTDTKYGFRCPFTHQYLLQSHLLPCETSNPLRNEYSHIVAFQLQDTVRKQSDQIQRLESQLEEMETKIHEGTDLYVDINRSYTVALEKFETRLREQDAYCKYLEERIMDTTEVLHKHIEHSYRANKLFDELKQETKALTEWCSRPIWNRTAAFNYEKEPECDFTSEF